MYMYYRPILVRRSPLLVELRDIQIEGSYHVPCPTYFNNILRYDMLHTLCVLYFILSYCLSLSLLLVFRHSVYYSGLLS